MQEKHGAWDWQWGRLDNRVEWVLRDWLHPNKPEGFAGKVVLDAGCGPGQHAAFYARWADKVVGVDLNTVGVARDRSGAPPNVEFVDGDIATFDDGRRFDVVTSIGVVHHTDDPDKTAAHLRTLLKPGGRLILWVYSKEGNALNRVLLEPVKTLFLHRLPRPALMTLARLATAALYPVIYTLYLLPLPFLPFYEYFGNFRRFPFSNNLMNVFDKMNAPQTDFISEERARAWVAGMTDPHVSPYVGVSWRVSGTRPIL